MSLLHELQAGGIELFMDGENIKLRGRPGVLTADLLATIKRCKSELVKELSVPPKDLPMTATPDRLTERQVDQLCRLMSSTGMSAFLWVLGEGGRADRYEHEQGFNHRDADLTAAVDYFLWRGKPGKETRTENIIQILGDA